MQHKITFYLDKALILPIGYQHLVQAMIYDCLRSMSELSRITHDTGHTLNNGQTFKLFCFSLLQGAYKISDKSIIFSEQMSLEIRTVLPEIDNALNKTFSAFQPLLLGNNKLSDYSYTQANKTITTEDILVKMASPICVYNTIYQEKKVYTNYHSPDSPIFFELICKNAAKKYYALHHSEPATTLKITAQKVSPHDKFVTKFKDHIYITAWNGSYNLHADSELLSFLYNTGIGSRNSQGFGLFDIIS